MSASKQFSLCEATARLALLALTLCLSGCGQRLQEFVSEEGKFRIRMPGTPVEASEDGLPAGVHKVNLVQRSGTFSVAWQDLPNDESKSADDLLDLNCTSGLERLKAKAITRKAITLGKHPGRELIAEWQSKNGVILDRLYLVDGRLYHVMASGAKWWVDASTTREVLDTFTLLRE